MSFVPSADDTIVAISTPAGRGGIGAVRLSGPQAAAIARSLFHPAAAQTRGEPGRAVLGAFAAAGGEPIDRGYLVIFAPPRTFTGEEVAELWAHGSPPVLRLLVEAAVARGARPATPGEFTLRAFLNGRLDATQAEAVRDLIEARTAYQARVAHEQASGRVSAAVDDLKDRLAGALSRLEAAIEFSEEPEAAHFLPEGGIVVEVRAVRAGMERLARSYDRGRLIREGAVAVLAGAPNVGKSSLFNRLLEDDRAIVTAVAGTTRDTIEETLDLGGVPVTLVDTAGLHEASGPADAEAVRRSRGALERADVVVAVLDWSRPLQAEEGDLIAAFDAQRLIVVLNKVDLACGVGLDRVLYLRQRHQVLEVSARACEGIEDLRRRLKEKISPGAALAPDSLFLTSLRQRDLLLRGASALERAEQGLSTGIGGEYLAVDLREALDALGEITGEVGSDEIYQRIFSTFCIGK